MTHYGRPQKKDSPAELRRPVPPSEAENSCPSVSASPAVQKAAGRVLALGGAMIAGFFLLMTVPQEETVQNRIPEGAAAVMSTAVTEREELAIPAETNTPSAGTGAEPFGYMDGEWNLWEYIGDLMWSLLS